MEEVKNRTYRRLAFIDKTGTKIIYIVDPSVSALGQPYLGGQGGGEVTILIFYRACVALTAFLSLIQYRILESEEAVIRFL